MIASVRDQGGTLTGVHRTWLDPSTRDKAPVATQRKAMGDLLGHAVRFGTALDIMAAGEGIEALMLAPAIGDFNEALRTLGTGALAAALRVQLVPEDVDRFLAAALAAEDRERAGDPASAVNGGSVRAGSERRERVTPTAF